MPLSLSSSPLYETRSSCSGAAATSPVSGPQATASGQLRRLSDVSSEDERLAENKEYLLYERQVEVLNDDGTPSVLETSILKLNTSGQQAAQSRNPTDEVELEVEVLPEGARAEVPKAETPPVEMLTEEEVEEEDDPDPISPLLGPNIVRYKNPGSRVVDVEVGVEVQEMMKQGPRSELEDGSLRGVGPEKSAGEQPLSAAPQVGRLPPQEQDEPVLRVVEKSQAQRGPAAGPVSASSTGGLEEDFVEVAALRAERARLQAEVESSNLELSKLRENALRMMKICSKFNTVCEKQSQAQEENGASSLTIPNQKVGAARRGSAPAAATFTATTPARKIKRAGVGEDSPTEPATAEKRKHDEGEQRPAPGVQQQSSSTASQKTNPKAAVDGEQENIIEDIIKSTSDEVRHPRAAHHGDLSRRGGTCMREMIRKLMDDFDDPDEKEEDRIVKDLAAHVPKMSPKTQQRAQSQPSLRASESLCNENRFTASYTSIPGTTPTSFLLGNTMEQRPAPSASNNKHHMEQTTSSWLKNRKPFPYRAPRRGRPKNVRQFFFSRTAGANAVPPPALCTRRPSSTAQPSVVRRSSTLTHDGTPSNSSAGCIKNMQPPQRPSPARISQYDLDHNDDQQQLQHDEDVHGGHEASQKSEQDGSPSFLSEIAAEESGVLDCSGLLLSQHCTQLQPSSSPCPPPPATTGGEKMMKMTRALMTVRALAGPEVDGDESNVVYHNERESALPSHEEVDQHRNFSPSSDRERSDVEDVPGEPGVPPQQHVEKGGKASSVGASPCATSGQIKDQARRGPPAGDDAPATNIGGLGGRASSGRLLIRKNTPRDGDGHDGQATAGGGEPLLSPAAAPAVIYKPRYSSGPAASVAVEGANGAGVEEVRKLTGPSSSSPDEVVAAELEQRGENVHHRGETCSGGGCTRTAEERERYVTRPPPQRHQTTVVPRLDLKQVGAGMHGQSREKTTSPSSATSTKICNNSALVDTSAEMGVVVVAAGAAVEHDDHKKRLSVMKIKPRAGDLALEQEPTENRTGRLQQNIESSPLRCSAAASPPSVLLQPPRQAATLRESVSLTTPRVEVQQQANEVVGGGQSALQLDSAESRLGTTSGGATVERSRTTVQRNCSSSAASIAPTANGVHQHERRGPAAAAIASRGTTGGANNFIHRPRPALQRPSSVAARKSPVFLVPPQAPLFFGHLGVAGAPRSSSCGNNRQQTAGAALQKVAHPQTPLTMSPLVLSPRPLPATSQILEEKRGNNKKPAASSAGVKFSLGLTPPALSLVGTPRPNWKEQGADEASAAVVNSENAAGKSGTSSSAEADRSECETVPAGPRSMRTPRRGPSPAQHVGASSVAAGRAVSHLPQYNPRRLLPSRSFGQEQKCLGGGQQIKIASSSAMTSSPRGAGEQAHNPCVRLNSTTTSPTPLVDGLSSTPSVHDVSAGQVMGQRKCRGGPSSSTLSGKPPIATSRAVSQKIPPGTMNPAMLTQEGGYFENLASPFPTPRFGSTSRRNSSVLSFGSRSRLPFLPNCSSGKN